MEQLTQLNKKVVQNLQRMFEKIARLKTKNSQVYDCRLFEASIEYCQAKCHIPFKTAMALIGQGLRDDFSDVDSKTGSLLDQTSMDVSSPDLTTTL